MPVGAKHLTGDVGRPLPASPLLRGNLTSRYLCDALAQVSATHLTEMPVAPYRHLPFFLPALPVSEGFACGGGFGILESQR